MNTEPHVNGKIVWASIKGAGASTSAIFCSLIIGVLFIPSTPEDDGHIRYAAVLSGFLPLVFGVLFIYYLLLSAKTDRPLKFALIVQSLLLFTLLLFIFDTAYSSDGLMISLLYFTITFGYFSFVFGFGAWAWSLPKNT